MEEWIEPKTNWTIKIINGQYGGDYFNASDYNRIAGNVSQLLGVYYGLTGDYTFTTARDFPLVKTVTDYLYADEFNNIIAAVNKMASTVPLPPLRIVYIDEGASPTFDELNKLETMIADLNNIAINQFNGRRKLPIHLGENGGIF